MPDFLGKLRVDLADADLNLTKQIEGLQNEQKRIRSALKALWFDEPSKPKSKSNGGAVRKVKVIALASTGRPKVREEVGAVPVDDVLAVLAQHDVATVEVLAKELDASRVMTHARLRDLSKGGLAEQMMEGWRLTRDGQQNWIQYRAKELKSRS